MIPACSQVAHQPDAIQLVDVAVPEENYEFISVTARSVHNAKLVGSALPSSSRWACPRLFEIEFIGRRNLLPRFYNASAYKFVVDKVVSVKRVPDSQHEEGECDSSAH